MLRLPTSHQGSTEQDTLWQFIVVMYKLLLVMVVTWAGLVVWRVELGLLRLFPRSRLGRSIKRRDLKRASVLDGHSTGKEPPHGSA